LAKDFALQGTRLISLKNNLNEAGNKTAKAVEKVMEVLERR